MKQLLAPRKKMLVLLTFLGAILIGMAWLMGVSEHARAQETQLLETSYKDVTPKKIGAGGTLLYTIVLRNSSTVSTTGGIEATDPLVPQLTYVTGSAVVIGGGGMGGFSGGHVRFSVDPIAAGGTVTLSFQAIVANTVLPGNIITNTATITEGGVAFTRSVAITIEDYPSAQINEPWNNQLFTGRGTVAIKGRAWTGEHPAFPEPPLLKPINNNSGANNWYTVQWEPVGGAIAYILQESSDPYFAQIKEFSPVVSPTVQQLITGQARGKTYYYRVKALKDVYESRWSIIQSVTVNPTGVSSELPAVLSEADSVPLLTATTPPTVEINIKKVGATVPDNWVRVTDMTSSSGGWWDWTYNWTLPIEDNAQYVIQVRAKGAGGAWDPTRIDTITVNIRNGIRYVYLPGIIKRYPPVPYAPALNVESNDTYGNYQLRWSYTPSTDPFAPTSYTLQEATDANFTSPTNETWSSTTFTRAYTSKAVGTYYYRVRGNNSYGAGPWSNVQTVVVNLRGFYDNFSNTASGWPRAVYWRGTQPVDGPVFDVNYENGSYRAKIMLNKDSWNNKRMGVVKSPYVNPFTNYEIEVDHRFAKAEDQVVPPEAGKAGLVFGANGNYSVVYVIEWNFEGSCAVSKYSNVTFPTMIVDPFKNVVYLRNWGGGCNLTTGYDKHNLVKVVVIGNKATVYINGTSIGTFTDNDLASYHNIGLMTGSWERTPVESRFDDFRVTPK
ncbi:MAG TPA: hypothetical protein PLJ78_01600 [Anaerolineae bacterium]|nr:hypothetical protein [Anaerolineae bacterium]